MPSCSTRAAHRSPALLTEAGRDVLAGAELSAAGRQYVDTALRRIDQLTAEIDPLRAQLVDFARRQRGCQALAVPLRHRLAVRGGHVVETGDARRFARSDQLVRFAGLDVTVYSSDAKRSPGRLSRQGSRSCGGRRLRPPNALLVAVRPTTPTTTSWRPSTTARTAKISPGRWSARSCAVAITRCVNWAILRWRCPRPDHRRWPLNHALRVLALPIHPLMPAASSRTVPCHHPAFGWTSWKD